MGLLRKWPPKENLKTLLGDQPKFKLKELTMLIEDAISTVLRSKLTDQEQAKLAENILETFQDIKDERELDKLEQQIDDDTEPLYDHEEVWKEIEELEAKGELPAN